jgi:hypothetical protein
MDEIEKNKERRAISVLLFSIFPLLFKKLRFE